MLYESGLATRDACRAASLAQILTGKTGCHEISGREFLDVANVLNNSHVWKSAAKHVGSAWVDLAQ